MSKRLPRGMKSSHSPGVHPQHASATPFVRDTLASDVRSAAGAIALTDALRHACLLKLGVRPLVSNRATVVAARSLAAFRPVCRRMEDRSISRGTRGSQAMLISAPAPIVEVSSGGCGSASTSESARSLNNAIAHEDAHASTTAALERVFAETARGCQPARSTRMPAAVTVVSMCITVFRPVVYGHTMVRRQPDAAPDSVDSRGSTDRPSHLKDSREA